MRLTPKVGVREKEGLSKWQGFTAVGTTNVKRKMRRSRRGVSERLGAGDFPDHRPKRSKSDSTEVSHLKRMMTMKFRGTE